MPTDIEITTDLLLKGALVFALMDTVYVPILIWRIKRDTFAQVKWPLAITAGIVWLGIWSWAIGNFWETVYFYVFPAWAQTWVPIIAAIATPLAALGFWTLSIRSRTSPVLIYCLLGGTLGSLTHIWAVYRGIVTKPPMLQGASPFAAIFIAFFEYMFYWCVILTLAGIVNWIKSQITRKYPESS